jgi:transposase InsO family protein
MREDMTRDIVIDALRMAWFKRHPSKQAGLIFHSDRGSQAGFKESSQHQLVERRIVGHQAPRQASSIPAFYEVCH